MKDEKMVCRRMLVGAVLSALSAFAVFSASADTYNKVEYSTSKTIEPGKWFSTFQSVLDYANAYNVPMVVFWGNKDCGHCKTVEESMGGSKDFKKWMEESGLVFAYVINGKNVSADGSVSMLAKRYAKSGSNYPYLGIYWKENTKGNKVGGKMGENATSYDGHYCADKWSWKKIRDTVNGKLKDWTPEKGGEFNFTESEGNRYEIEVGSTGVEVSLTRRPQAAKDAYENTVEVILPDKSVTRSTLSWAAGESETNLVVALPDLSGLKAGDTVTIRMDGNDRNTLQVHYVEKENSSSNPLWLDERTTPQPKKLLTAAKGAAAPALRFGEWTMDLVGAKNLAAASNGYTLVSVQGSLWCHDCANTERNFLDIEENGENLVRKWAEEKKVALVAMDLPSMNKEDPLGEKSTCLLSRKVVETRLAVESSSSHDVTQGGADPALTEYVPRSGLAYQTRKGITAEQASAMLAEFQRLASTNTDPDPVKGGFHRPEDGNPARPGVPSFVLLRTDGTVAARLTRFGTKSPMKFDTDGKTLIATVERTKNILKRFDEMIEIANAKAGDVDSTEIENNYPSDGSPVLTVGGAEANGRLSHADAIDTFKLVGVTGNVQLKTTVKGSSDAEVKVQYVLKDAFGNVTDVGVGKTGKLSAGIDLSDVITRAGTCYVRISQKDITSSAFDVYGANETFAAFSVTNSLLTLVPGEDASTVRASDGEAFDMFVVEGEKYRLQGVKGGVPGLTDLGDGLYDCTVGGTASVTVDGDFTYQKWVPGEVGFFPDEPKSVKETSADWKIRLGRSNGMSGDVTVRVWLDRLETDYFFDNWEDEKNPITGEYTYKQYPRFTINDGWDTLPPDLAKTFETNLTFKEGMAYAATSNSFTIGFAQVEELRKKYFGDGKIILRLEVVSGPAKVGKGTYTINVTETSSSKPGTVYMKTAKPFFAKSYTVYARKSSTVDVVLGRATACQGLVRTKFTQSKGGALLLSGDPETSTNAWEKSFTQLWWNHDDDDKTITVTNLPAVGKSVKLTLSPVKPFKVKSSSSKTVTIVSVADDALEFEACEYGFTNLLRYVAYELACPLSEAYQPSGISLTAKKLSGSIPSGLTAKVVKDNDGKVSLVFAGVPTKAVSSCSAVYQLVENRGTKKNPKNFASLPVKVTFRVVDPTAASTATSADPAIAAIANPAIKSTRTLYDLMVWESNTVDRLAGKLTLTIPATGKVSAKYVCSEGTIAFSAKSWSGKEIGEEDADGTYTAVLTPTKSAYRGRYELTVNAFANGNVTATVIDPLYEGTEFSAYSDGRVWAAENKKKKIEAHTAKDWKGRYTVALMPAEAWVKDGDHNDKQLPGKIEEAVAGTAPCGAGYLALDMSKSSAYNVGKMKWAGKLANGTTVSGSTVLTEGVDGFLGVTGVAYLPIYTRVTTNLDSKKKNVTLDRLAVILKIEKNAADCPRAVLPADELASGEWIHTVTKPANAGRLDYRMTVYPFGSFFDPNKSLAACCKDAQVSDHQLMYADGVEDGFPVQMLIATKAKAKDYPKETIKVAESAATNVRKVKITSFSRSSGVVVGTFKMPNTNKEASWRGVILTGWTCTCGCGDPSEEYLLPFVNGYYAYGDTGCYDPEKDKMASIKRGNMVYFIDVRDLD